MTERYRMIHANARKKLRRMELSQKLLDGSDKYDISMVTLTSQADIDQARLIVRKTHIAAVISILACSLILIAAIVLLAVQSTVSTARRHGYADGLTGISPQALWDDTDASPVEDTLPTDLKGCIIAYYRFGCEDCNATYDKLHPALEQLAPTYYVATRSELGRRMIQIYPVASVPSCVYIKHDGFPLYYTLYKLDGGTAYVDEEALANLSQAVIYDQTLHEFTDSDSTDSTD